MSRCHYIYDKSAGKVLIPNCWQVVHTNDISQCTCKIETYEQFEKDIYNEVLNKVKKDNENLQQEVFYLNRIIKQLIKHKNISIKKGKKI